MGHTRKIEIMKGLWWPDFGTCRRERGREREEGREGGRERERKKEREREKV